MGGVHRRVLLMGGVHRSATHGRRPQESATHGWGPQECYSWAGSTCRRVLLVGGVHRRVLLAGGLGCWCLCRPFLLPSVSYMDNAVHNSHSCTWPMQGVHHSMSTTHTHLLIDNTTPARPSCFRTSLLGSRPTLLTHDCTYNCSPCTCRCKYIICV